MQQGGVRAWEGYHCTAEVYDTKQVATPWEAHLITQKYKDQVHPNMGTGIRGAKILRLSCKTIIPSFVHKAQYLKQAPQPGGLH